MKRVFRGSAIFFSILLFLAWAAAAPAQQGQAERKPWNADEVKGLADQLATEFKDARQTARREVGLQNVSTGSDRAAKQFMDKLRLLEKSATQYAARVNGGGGFDETVGIARKIGVQLRDLEVLSRRLHLIKGTTDAVAAAHKTINQLSPYYGASPLYPEAESVGEAESAPGS